MTRFRNQTAVFATLALLSGAISAHADDVVTVRFAALGRVTSQAPGPGGTLVVAARGHATHLGRYNAAVILTIIPQGPAAPPKFRGTVTMTAANGEKLRAINFGLMTSPLPNPGGAGGYEITGGTGRFVGATGRGDFSSFGGVTKFRGTINLRPRNQRAP